MSITDIFFPKKHQSGLTLSLKKRVPFIVATDLILLIYFIFSAYQRFSAQREAALMFFVLVCITSIAFIASLLFIRLKKYSIASVLTGWACLINLCWLAFLLPLVEVSEMYRFLAYLLAAVVCNSLVGLMKYQLEAYFLSSVIPFAAYSFLIAIPKFPKEGMTIFATSVVALIVINIIVILMRSYNNSLIQVAENEMRVNKDKLSQLEDLLENSQDSFKIGEVLKNETLATKKASAEIKSMLLELEKQANILVKDAEASDSVNKKIVSYANSMQESVISQNASLDETSTAVTEIMATIQNIGNVANTKKTAVHQVVELLEVQKRHATKAKADMERIQESSKQAKNVIGTINDVSEKTGLLAMNASIEAAHAGSSGKGFSVIAQEIRKLADETKTSTASIGVSLDQNGQVVFESAETISAFAQTIDEVTREVTSTLNAMEEILNGISEISIGTKELTQATAEMVTIAHETETSVKGVTEKISDGAENIEHISQFSLSVLDRIKKLLVNFSTIESVINNIEVAGEDNSKSIFELNEEIKKISSSERTSVCN